MSKNLSELAGRKGVSKTLFEELGIAARQTGSPSVEKMEELAEAFVMGKANVFGATSFYDFLKPENKGKKVYICNGSSCMTAGTQPALKGKLLVHYTPDEIGDMCCLGRCHENSSFNINGKNYSGNAVDEIDSIKKNSTEVADTLLGMMIAGYITGAGTGVVYIRAEYPEAISITQNAIASLYQQNLLGENILQSGFDFHFKVISAQGAYICGEETALLSSIEGQRPEVRVRPPYPVQQGLFNKPTVVNNVETLACIPYILKNGGEKFASIGIGKSTGTKLISLDGFFNKPGIYEVDMGTPLAVVVNDLGGGFRSPVKAMHIGGPLGGLVPIEKINELTVDFESFAKNGFLLGHASVVCIPEHFPIIKYLEHLFQFTAHESCGKCFPCRIGSTRGAEMLKKAQETEYRIDRTLFDDLVETLEIGSLCALGGGLPLPVKNALQYFDKELSVYFKKS
ncbi:MAG: NAD(P)H-dependent oxidoreductase subunit E [Chitinophagaceae bacterium]|nr:NAD(P)H-dependent oxidoreductase subunit E [Chitinophagaceae bacterium]